MKREKLPKIHTWQEQMRRKQQDRSNRRQRTRGAAAKKSLQEWGY